MRRHFENPNNNVRKYTKILYVNKLFSQILNMHIYPTIHIYSLAKYTIFSSAYIRDR